MVAPVIPGLTDHEMPQILKEAALHGAKFAGYVPLSLSFVLDDLFQSWLDSHFQTKKEKV